MPSAIEKIAADLKAAMLARDAVKLGTLRMLKSAMQYYQIEKKLETLAEGDLIAVVQKQLKQRQDAIDSYRTAGRNDLLEKEAAELAILKGYLPAALSSDEVEALVKAVIAEVGATSKAQVGLVMKGAIARAAGRADGKTINSVALKLLGA